MGLTTYGWDFAILESSENSIELKLAVNVGLLQLDVGRSIDLGGRRHDGDGEWGIIWGISEKGERNTAKSRERLAELVLID